MIKHTVVDNNYDWDDSKVLLGTLTQACKVINDRLTVRLPISCSMLELLLFELKRELNSQCYLQIMYMALFAMGYYRLMRIGELTTNEGKHTVKAADVHMALNKKKLLIVLYSSKTHSKASRPQKIKIIANKDEKTGSYAHRHFCPHTLIHNFIEVRGSYDSIHEEFFVFRDRKPVSSDNARTVLRKLIKNIGLNEKLYDMHSFCIDRSSDLVKYGYSIEEVKRMGRWKSNAVFRYIRN